MNPSDFLSPEQPTPVADWVFAKAQEIAGIWSDQTDLQRTQSMITAVIAWLETELPKQK